TFNKRKPINKPMVCLCKFTHGSLKWQTA
ncbi:copper/silver resistance outer membrane domain protein, partial [Vibrio parahaemolyticus V-223/04]